MSPFFGIQLAHLILQVRLDFPSFVVLCSPEYARDCIDLERSVLTPLAEAGKLYVYKMTSGFWCQVKTAG